MLIGRKGGGGLVNFPLHKAFVLKYTAFFVNREEGGLVYFPVHRAFVLKYSAIFGGLRKYSLVSGVLRRPVYKSTRVTRTRILIYKVKKTKICMVLKNLNVNHCFDSL